MLLDLPGLFLPCSLPQLLSAAAGGSLEPSPVRRFRGAFPHRLLSYAKDSSVADSFAHGTLRTPVSFRVAAAANSPDRRELRESP
jgi:hypothetical protein